VPRNSRHFGQKVDTLLKKAGTTVKINYLKKNSKIFSVIAWQTLSDYCLIAFFKLKKINVTRLNQSFFKFLIFYFML